MRSTELRMASEKDASESSGPSATARSRIGYLWIHLNKQPFWDKHSHGPVYLTHEFAVHSVVRQVNEVGIRR